jgi:hypothetical protein
MIGDVQLNSSKNLVENLPKLEKNVSWKDMG